MRTRLPAIVFSSLLFLSGWVQPAAGAEDKVLSFGDMGFLDGFVTDGGRAVVALRPSPELERVRSTLVSWNGGEAHAEEIDFLVKSFRQASEGRFLAWGFRRQDDEHPWGFRVYRVTPSAFKLEREVDLDPKWMAEGSWAWTSHDLSVWVGMRNLYPQGTERLPAQALGREFAVGSMRTGKAMRTIGVELFPAYPLLHDTVAFVILNSDGPTVLASHSTHLFLHRLSRQGVESRPIDHLREVVHSGSDLAVVWQEDDRVLWARSGDEWQAYDLWNLAYTFDVPREPFLRHKTASGRPHPTRGFVEVEEDGVGRFRVRYFWQSPQFPEWKEERLSGWQRGKRPFEPIVSPGGRHFLAIDSGRSEDGTYSTTARRVELTLAPPPLPPEAAAPPEDGEEKVQQRPADG